MRTQPCAHALDVGRRSAPAASAASDSRRRIVRGMADNLGGRADRRNTGKQLPGVNARPDHGLRTMAATIDTVAQRCLSNATAVESTIYYVLEGEPGVSVAGAWRGPGMRGNCSAPMSLDQVELGADRALTPPG